MRQPEGMYEEWDCTSGIGKIELSEIAMAINLCKADENYESDITDLRGMIRFLNEQILATGYTGLN